MDIFSFPVSVLLGVAFILLAYILHRYGAGTALVRVLSSRGAAIISLSAVSIIMAVDGVWSVGIAHSLWLGITLPIVTLCLALTLLDGFKLRKSPCFLLCHGGLFIIVFASYFGAADVEKMKIALREGGEPQSCAYHMDGSLAPLPFELSLSSFETEYYEGTDRPRQYRSKMLIGGQAFETSVNHPCRHRGYAFFQDGFTGEYSVIGISRDPWLPLVYIGMSILAVGCLLLLAGKWRLGVAIPVALVVAAAFTAVSMARINLGTLMPVLRSLWFVPHLIVYMVAYSLMAVALVLSLFQTFSKGRKSDGSLVDSMLRISSALIAIGMLCGSVWARQAWGDYWAWDPKECLAAVTWLLTLVYIHIQPRHRRGLLCVLVAAFIALQFTWYGVKYLPSASNSMHTYNS